jgi:hypothetical protein
MRMIALTVCGCLLIGTAGAAFGQAMTAAVPPPAGATKICAPYVSNQWRLSTPTPGTWSIDDCRGFAQSVGAVTTQVGCFFEKEPAGGVTKWALGGAFPSGNTPTPAALPSPNCGW